MGIPGWVPWLRKIAPDAFETLSPKGLSGETVAVDASYVLTALLKATASRSTADQSREERTQWAIRTKVGSLKKQGIHPIFVFDGQAPEEKSQTLRRRAEERDRLRQRAQDDQAQNARLDAYLPENAFELCAPILDELGIPYVRAQGEADAVIAGLVISQRAYAALSEDADLLLYGCPRLLKGWGQKGGECIHLERLCHKLELSLEAFRDMGILVGTDYHPRFEGIGPARALGFLQRYSSLEEVSLKANVRFQVPIDRLRQLFQPVIVTI
jgi:5'-3' exonuclease